MVAMPSWKPPKNIAKTLEDSGGFWEDERWSPITLTAMSGTEYDGREIPVAWQVEFDPSEDEFEAANAKLEDADLEPDGYGWGEYIQEVIRKSDPALANRLNTDDCEVGACVIWVESEDDCRVLLEAIWTIVFKE
ncbi:hypothetical protein [Schlesneria paludicola]|uniref:hypothetical protein n=1 Tax=Schlesneria paludicola TaxID=360056 RepID=UPI00029A63FD|nr:hypothetical protein [Schlesneria paludicola]